MFLFHPLHFLKFLVKSQPQRSYKKGSYKKKRVYSSWEITREYKVLWSEPDNIRFLAFLGPMKQALTSELSQPDQLTVNQPTDQLNKPDQNTYYYLS